MPYCKTALIVTEQMNTRLVLDQLAQTMFNAPRAVVDNDRGFILLYCRYSPYIDIGEEVIKKFADEQDYSTECLEC